MPDISLLQLVLANLAIAAGACLQGVAGYGIGTLSAPLLFLISPILLPAPLVLNATLLTIFMLVRNRAALEIRQVRFAIGGGVIGMILAGVALSVGGLRPRLNAANSAIAGAASTYMGTITAIGGPPIALIYQNEKGPLVRANMSAFFLVASFLSLTALLFSGYLGYREFLLFAATFPGVLLGFWLSGRLVHRVPFERLRPLILGIAAVAGSAALVRGLLTL